MATVTKTQAAGDLIGDLDTLNANLNRRLSAVADETVEIVGQWDRLGAIGAQRDDYAACLMVKIKPHLRELARYATAAVAMIERLEANPFGD